MEAMLRRVRTTAASPVSAVSILRDAGWRLYFASSDVQYGWPSLWVKLHRPSMSVA
jgi:hypothetical protein